MSYIIIIDTLLLLSDIST